MQKRKIEDVIDEAALHDDPEIIIEHYLNEVPMTEGYRKGLRRKWEFCLIHDPEGPYHHKVNQYPPIFPDR